MPSNPTTKSQVHAYKFVLRRMQSALVRKDSVMLHDPMRTHTRATLVGVVLSALAVLGVVIFGFFRPSPAPPGPGTIVIGEPSGQMYVMTGKPKELIPTFNLASARLILAAQQRKGSSAPAGGGGGGSVEVVQPEVIPDDQLMGIPQGQPTGIPYGPPLMPSKEQRISPNWAVCDKVKLDKDLPAQVARDRATTETTVMAGVSDLGRELGSDEALLVKAQRTGKTYLVYRLDQHANRPNADVVRAQVDLKDNAVRFAYDLNERPRKVSAEMLNAIPEVSPIEPPSIAGGGKVKWGLGLGVGEVFYTPRADGGSQYYVITQGGIQQVSKAVADLIRADKSGGATGGIQRRAPNQVAGVPQVQQGAQAHLGVAEFPRSQPVVLSPAQTPVSCLGWHITGNGKNREGHTTLYVGPSSPVPDAKSVDVAQASPDGYQVEQFYMPPGHAAVVRSVTSREQIGKGGPIQLVSSQGVRYGVPRAQTAKVLGLASQDPAPELILRLLPTGSSLSMQAALREWSPRDMNSAADAPE